MMGVAEAIDVTPWHGWEISNQPGDWSLGPLIAFGRKADLRAAGGRLTLRLDGEDVLTTTVPGRLQQVEIGEARFTCRLPDLLPEGTEIGLPHVTPAQIKSARIETPGVKTSRHATADLAPAADLSNSGTLLRLPSAAAGSVLVVAW
jgi:hypothetical protein